MTSCFFPHYGNLVAGTVTLIVGIHDSNQLRVEPVLLRTPPSPRPLPMASFVWEPFNKQEYSVSFGRDDDSFSAESNSGISATAPSAVVLTSVLEGVKPINYLHTRDSDKSTLAGTAVLSLESLCPPFNGSPHSNLFCHRFRIKFHASGHTHVHAVSPFEFTSCFGLTNQLRYCILQQANWYALDGGIPGLTSAWIFDHILEQLMLICDSNIEVFSPNQFAAPAAHIQTFVSGVTATRIPNRNRWVQAIASDAKLSKIKKIMANPSLLTNKLLAGINYNYHAALR